MSQLRALSYNEWCFILSSLDERILFEIEGVYQIGDKSEFWIIKTKNIVYGVDEFLNIYVGQTIINKNKNPALSTLLKNNKFDILCPMLLNIWDDIKDSKISVSVQGKFFKCFNKRFMFYMVSPESGGMKVKHAYNMVIREVPQDLKHVGCYGLIKFMYDSQSNMIVSCHKDC